MAIEQKSSFCRFCSALCGIVVTVDGDQVIEVRGDTNHPLSNGYTCPKGRALGAWHHHPQRLDHPQVGRGSERRAVSWHECLSSLAAEITRLQAEHGPDSVGFYMATASSFDSAGGRVAFRLAQAIATKSRYTAVTIDTPCRPLVSDLLSGQAGLMPCIDADTAGLTVLVGTNPVVSHGHTTSLPDPVNRLRALAKAPKELWVIDPRRTETARLATKHLAVQPGSDHALLAYVVREVLREGADSAYLADRANADDIERLKAAVAPYDLDRAVSETGLTAEDLKGFLASIRRFGKLGAITGTGTTMAASATATEWLVWVLQIITGSYEAPGGLWFHPGFLRCFDRRNLRPSPPEPIDWPRPPSRPDLPGFYGEFPCAALVDEIEAGNLRALIVIGGNPANALPDAARLDAALAKLEVLAVADVVATETVAHATHVLPCAGQLERADVPDYVDQYYSVVASHHTAPIVPLCAERKPLWWIAATLGSKLGHTLLPDTIDVDTATDDDMLDLFCGRGRLPLDELRAAPTAVIAEGPVRGWVHDKALPEGKWRLAPQALVDDLARWTNTTPIRKPGTLTLIPKRQLRTLNSQLRDAAAPGGRFDEARVALHPSDASSLGVTDGQPVEVRAATGETVGRVLVDEGMLPGTVSIPHGWTDTRVGMLTTGRAGADPLTGMVLQSGVEVTVHPA